MNPVLLACLVAVAGGVGSALRFLVDNAVARAFRGRYPAGTMLINLTGSFALGLVVGAGLGGGRPDMVWATVVGTGLLGGYTTFSTASLEAFRLLEERRYGAAALHGPGMMVACVSAAIVGIALAR